MLAVVSQGAQMGLKECQNQFAGRRWNCSTLFEKGLSVSTEHLLDDTDKNKNISDKLTKYRRLADSRSKMLADSPLEVEDVGDVFGGILKFHSREKAYVHAISAAGVAYSITRACSQGQMPSCSCDQNVERRKVKKKDQWDWGGCSEDVAYGERLSKDFVDSNELAKAWYDPAPKLMNLHNNEAGRRCYS
ncbi:unnamed protein product [Soboliphyme baturini]|uniref:Protein Wnt n=1 Tax=Soboliphyme baturini TaxID=241478 RepID=A0A183IU65_9BILA|nr:unnamed protein product [Soboliphyme baturini]